MKDFDEIDDRDVELGYFSSICSFCVHLYAIRYCDAFPDGIPIEIWSGKNNHTQPFHDDNGIRFERGKPKIRQI
jgi:hypothetical protein